MVAEILLVPGSDAEEMRAGAQYVGRGLSGIGVRVREQISLCPDTLKLQQAVAAGLARSNVLIVLGGMGRAGGYLSKLVISQGLNLPLEPSRETLAAIQAYCKRSGEPFDVDDLDLANLPRGATPFPPTYGKIPGCLISSARQHIILLPENGREIAPMLNHYVIPALGGRESSTTVTRTLRTYGVPEKAVRERLHDFTASANPVVTVQKEGNEVLVRVTAHASSGQRAAALCTPVLRSIVDRMGDTAYGLDVDSLQAAVIQKMNRKSLELGVAEAGINGMLTRVISESEGGNELLRYSVVADSDQVKADKLDVRPKLLRKRGSVSEYAAVAMAAGALGHTDAGGVGVGVAANTRDTKDKKCPVGTVYIAVCDEESVSVKKLVVGDGSASPDAIMDAAVSRALNMIRLFVDYLPEPYPGSIPLDQALKGKKTVTDGDEYDGEPAWAEDGEEEETGGGSGIVRKLVFTLALLIFLGSGGYLGKLYYDSWKASNLASQLQNLFEYGDMGEVELSPDYPSDYLIKFAGLWNRNKDVVAYINIDGTTVKYPIVQYTDNAHYLRLDYDGNYSQHGIPFLDFRADVGQPSTNLVVYGHNMKDGQVFGELMNYKDLDYYKEHPVIDFHTVYREGQYKIFALFITNAYAEQGPVFNYHDFTNAASEQDFTGFVSQVKARSLINTTVDVQPGDQLLTLSSCSYEFTDARFVVVARRVRSGESAEVNTADAVTNPNPLMPDIWYNIYGGTKPVVEDYVVNTAAAAAGTAYENGLSHAFGEYGVEGERASGFYDAIEHLEVSSLVSDAADIVSMAAFRASQREPSQPEAESQTADVSQLAAESSQAEASRLAAESQAAEASRLAAESSQAEASRLAAESSQAEASRLAAESSQAEASRLAAESSQAEASRLAAESSKAEASRLAAESGKAVEASRLSASPLQEQNDQVDTDGGTRTPAASAGSGSGGTSTGDSGSFGTLTAYVNGVHTKADALDLVAGVVQNEVGASFHTEAIKAQAVATYTWMVNSLEKGETPSVYYTSSVSSKVRSAVEEVMGEMVLYQGKAAFTPYHATSAGATTSSRDVWGGSFPYLVSVESPVDKQHSSYRTQTSMTADKVSSLISSKLGIDCDGDPEDWIQILDYAEGGYVGKMSIGGRTKSAKTGSTLTGRLVRESVFNLRSACFEVEYDASSDKFLFTTYGYGHGVGMSQNGANLYAQQGWSYIEILEHYYPGTTVR